jgi:diacylglycerol kinase family enzyme
LKRPKLAVVLNPNALGVRRAPGLAQRLRAVVGEMGEVVVTHTPAELAETARRFAAEGVQLVAACGGDGTNLATLTELVRAYGAEQLPRFAILRGGTVNTIAGNLGIRGRPEELLGRLVVALRGGHVATVDQDLLEIDGRYGFLFASLMGARFLEAYYRNANPGPAVAALLALRTAASSLVQGRFAGWLFAPVPVELTVDGERLPDAHYRLLVASVVPDVGIGMRVAWQAGQKARHFHLIASGISTTSMALQLPRVLSGRPLAGAPHVDRLATRVQLRFTEPLSYTLDGDLFAANELTISIGPRVALVRA